MTKTYKYRPGSVGMRVSATVAGEELDRIRAKHGVVLPKDVVNEARPEEAPLHPVFEWDDAEAGENWRKWQARNLIRNIFVIHDDKPAINQFVSVHAAPDDYEGEFKSGYYRTEDVLADPGMYRSAVMFMSRQLSSVKQSIQQLVDAAKEEGIEFRPTESKAVQSIGRQIDLASKNAETLKSRVTKQSRKQA